MAITFISQKSRNEMLRWRVARVHSQIQFQSLSTACRIHNRKSNPRPLRARLQIRPSRSRPYRSQRHPPHSRDGSRYDRRRLSAETKADSVWDDNVFWQHLPCVPSSLWKLVFSLQGLNTPAHEPLWKRLPRCFDQSGFVWSCVFPFDSHPGSERKRLLCRIDRAYIIESIVHKKYL